MSDFGWKVNLGLCNLFIAIVLLGLTYQVRIMTLASTVFKQEGQVALNCSPEFCLKLTYRYLLKAGHAPVDTWGEANFRPRGII